MHNDNPGLPQISPTVAYTPNRKILYVDDEANLLSAFVSLLRRERVTTVTLQDSRQIEHTLNAEGPFAVVFSDQRMPGLDGVAVLETVGRMHPDTIRILVTGYADYNDTIRAINSGGISHFIAKPWKDDELRKLVQETIQRYNLAEENKFLLGALQRANVDLAELLDGTVTGTVRILSDILSNTSPAASAQVERIRRLGSKFLEMLPNLSSAERWDIERALDLFNLGIVLMPPAMFGSLSKVDAGQFAKFSLLKNHYMLAANLLRDIPRFQGVARIIQLSAKNFDGSGEPVSEQVKGKDIPLGARLLHILLDLDRVVAEKGQGRAVLERMRKTPARYDGELIEVMLGLRPTATPAGDEHVVGLNELRPGMVILDDVVTESGQFLMKAGYTLTETAIKILIQWHAHEPIHHKFRVQTPQHLGAA